MTTAQHLDRSITIERGVTSRNEFNEAVNVWSTILTVRARREDVSDGEKFAAGGIGGFLAARFVVRSTQRTRDILYVDRIVHEGRQWNIVGIKEAKDSRRGFIEITATGSAD